MISNFLLKLSTCSCSYFSKNNFCQLQFSIKQLIKLDSSLYNSKFCWCKDEDTQFLNLVLNRLSDDDI